MHGVSQRKIPKLLYYIPVKMIFFDSVQLCAASVKLCVTSPGKCFSVFVRHIWFKNKYLHGIENHGISA